MKNNQGFEMEKCNGCQFARKIGAGNWYFIGCTHDPYKGKWIAELKSCPLIEDEGN